MAMLDSTVVNLALDAIGSEVDASLTDLHWLATGYLIALAVALPATAWLGRRLGSGRVWAVSLVVFVLASIACALSSSLGVLIGARCAQGLAAGVMVPVGQAMLASLADKRQLGRLMGVVGFAVALGPALGPGVAGIILDAAGWRWLFWLNVPIGILGLLAARVLNLPKAKNPKAGFDFKGFVLIGAGLPLVLYSGASIGSPDAGWPEALTAALGAVLTGAFILHNARSRNPLLDLSLLRRTRFAAAVITSGLTGAAMYGGLLALPLLLYYKLDQSPTEAGIALLVMGLGSAVALPLAGALKDRFSAAPVCLAGGALLTLGTLPYWPAAMLPLPLLAVLLFVRGAGLALAQMAAMVAAYDETTREQAGDAAALVNMVQRLGGAGGALAVTAMLNQSTGTESGMAFDLAFLVLMAFPLGAVLTATRLRRERHRERAGPRDTEGQATARSESSAGDAASE